MIFIAGTLRINFCHAHVNKNRCFLGNPYHVSHTHISSCTEILTLILPGRCHGHFPVFRWETEALSDWETHPAPQWQSVREIMSHNLPILKPSGGLFSLIILHKAAHKWIEISIKSLWGNWKLNHSFLLPHFYLLLGAQICNSALKLSYDLMCFSLQFCAGKPEEDFSYYCKWSKWNVACKEKWIVNNWESLVFFENICHQMKRDFRMSIHFILFVPHPPSPLYSSPTFQIALIHRLILRYFSELCS